MKKLDAAYKIARASGSISDYNLFKFLRAKVKNALDSEAQWREL